MKLSYFSYDFGVCCCEAVNAAVCVGTFRWAGLLCVPVGGGPTARRTRRELRSARRLEARPCPPVPPAPSTPAAPGVLMRIHIIAEPTPNFARNSPTTLSNPGIRSLELQRFQTVLKLLLIELRATFLRQAPPPPRLKPMTPMRVDHCHEMKPPTPLRAPWHTRLKPLTPLLAQNSQIQAIFRPQRCHGFHAPLTEHPQRRRRFHQTPNQGFWFSARYSDAHACCLRHNPGSVGA